MTDIDDLVNSTHREVGSGHGADGEARAVMMRRRYHDPIQDVWDACTDPDRLKRFFLPVAGDLRVGGTFQFEGNAGGEILRCEPPRLLRVTWVYGDGPASEVELRLSPGEGGGTVLELEHAPVAKRVEIAGRQVDPILNDAETGIWGMGTGWELGLIALERFLRGQMPADYGTEQFEVTPEIMALADRCGQAWAAAVADATASGQPTPGQPTLSQQEA